jgi:membrane-associated phospholipid phosphatase
MADRSQTSIAGVRATRRLALLGLGAAFGAAAVYVVTVGTRAGQLIGGLMLGGRPPALEQVTTAESVLETLSRSSLAVGVVLILTIALLQGRPRLAVAALIVVIGANVTTQLLKQILLDRVDLLGGLFYPLPNSFPSGHATAAASLAVGTILVVPPLLRAPTIVLSALVVALVGVSTLVTGWHRMADAVGGTFVATSWGAGLGAFLAWRRGVELVGQRTAELGRVGARTSIAFGAWLVVLGAFAYVFAALDPLEVLLLLAERGGSPALFGIGVVIVVGATFLTLGSLGLALRDVRLDPRPTKPEVGSPDPDRRASSQPTAPGSRHEGPRAG